MARRVLLDRNNKMQTFYSHLQYKTHLTLSILANNNSNNKSPLQDNSTFKRNIKENNKLFRKPSNPHHLMLKPIHFSNHYLFKQDKLRKFITSLTISSNSPPLKTFTLIRTTFFRNQKDYQTINQQNKPKPSN